MWPVVGLVAYGGYKAYKYISSSKKSSKTPDKPNKLQEEVKKGQAPREVKRVDNGHVNGKPHVHFKDGTALNNDGTPHDKYKGNPKISNQVDKWLKKHGWKGKK